MRRFFAAYWKVLSGFRYRAIAAIVMSGLSGLMEGTAMLFLVPIMGQGIANTQSGDYGPLPHFIAQMMRSIDKGKISLFIAFIVAGVASALLKLTAQALALSVRNRIEEKLRRETGEALFHVDWPYFLNLRLGNMGKAVVTETTTAAEGCMALIGLLGQCVICIFLVWISLMISVPMTMITFLFGGVTGLLYYVFGRRAMRHAQSWLNSTTVIAEKISELFNHLKHIRGSGLTHAAIEQTEVAYHDYNRYYFRSVFYKDALRATLECAAIFLMAGFLAYGFFWSGEKAQWAIVFLAVFYRLMPRISSIQDGFYICGIYSIWLTTAMNRIDTLRQNKMRSTSGEPVGLIDRLDIHEVSYQYPEGIHPVLNHIQFSLEKGRVLILTGDSGSGKTTLMDLILGLLEPTSGTLQMNGRSLKDYDLNSWRSRIGLVLQGSPIFHGTVLENIAFFKEPIDKEKAWRCAEMADASEFIRQLPQGMDTSIGEKGGRLSGGQKQRIALARALYRDPWLLILDEPTSELDEDSQTRIIDTLKSLKPHYAILMSSHRTSTLAIADRILHLPSGRLEDRASVA